MKQLLLILPLIFAFSIPANAKIRCKGPYQIVKGSHIFTPYCEDNYLARIARGYSIRVSNRQIRNNPNKKESVCRFIGHDIRVMNICEQYRGNSGFGHF